MTRRVQMEICCGSYEDALNADRGGADRVELCSALTLGGLTPSLGSLALAKRNLKVRVMAMLRPRAAGFCYRPAEVEVMRQDAALFIDHGADALVFGFLRPDATVDEALTRAFVALAKGRETTFHRAFDVVPDPFAALDTLIACGVTRVLTSGQAPTALEGADLIRRLIRHGMGRIQILPGAGIKEHNALAVLEATGADQLHFTAGAGQTDDSLRNAQVRFNAATMPGECDFSVTSADKVHQMRGLIQSADSRANSLL